MYNFFSTIYKGLRLLWAQLSWSAIAWMRQREIATIHARLRDEYQRLGQAIHNAWQANQPMDISSGEMALALRQVDFLLDEIRHLEQSLAQDRQQFFHAKGLTPQPPSE